MTSRRDFYITDEYNDRWNEESLPTFKQARDFRNYIRPELNYSRDLRIISFPRPPSEFNSRANDASPKERVTNFSSSEF